MMARENVRAHLLDIMYAQSGDCYVPKVFVKRRLSMKRLQGVNFNKPSDIVLFAKEALGLPRYTEERVYGLALNGTYDLLAAFDVAKGTAMYAVTTPRKFYMRMLIVGATYGVVLHNHTGSSTVPSDADDAFTLRLMVAGDVLGVRLLDHIIVADGDESFYSYALHDRMDYDALDAL